MTRHDPVPTVGKERKVRSAYTSEFVRVYEKEQRVELT
jgi:hypothetical protein